MRDIHTAQPGDFIAIFSSMTINATEVDRWLLCVVDSVSPVGVAQTCHRIDDPPGWVCMVVPQSNLHPSYVIQRTRLRDPEAFLQEAAATSPHTIAEIVEIFRGYASSYELRIAQEMKLIAERHGGLLYVHEDQAGTRIDWEDRSGRGEGRFTTFVKRNPDDDPGSDQGKMAGPADE